MISFLGCNFGRIKQYTRRYEYQTEHHLHLGEQEEDTYIDIADDIKANAMSQFNQL